MPGLGQYGQGHEMTLPPLASIWESIKNLVRDLVGFWLSLSTFNKLCIGFFCLSQVFPICLNIYTHNNIMSVRRRLSKRRPVKEQPQIAKSQTMPTLEDSAANDSSTRLPKGRIPPTKAELDAVADHCVQDADGNKIPFKQLYEAKPRVLIIFIRHFFCGVRFPFALNQRYPFIPRLLFQSLPEPPSSIQANTPSSSELPRIPTYPLLGPHSLLPLRPPPSHLPYRHRLRFSLTNPNVHHRNILSLPTVRRSHQTPLQTPQHGAIPLPRQTPSRLHARIHSRQLAAEFPPGTPRWQRVDAQGRQFQPKRRGVHFRARGMYLGKQDAEHARSRRARGPATRAPIPRGARPQEGEMVEWGRPLVVQSREAPILGFVFQTAELVGETHESGSGW